MNEVLDELEECIPALNSVESSIIGKELETIIADFVRGLPEKVFYVPLLLDKASERGFFII